MDSTEPSRDLFSFNIRFNARLGRKLIGCGGRARTSAPQQSGSIRITLPTGDVDGRSLMSSPPATTAAMSSSSKSPSSSAEMACRGKEALVYQTLTGDPAATEG